MDYYDLGSYGRQVTTSSPTAQIWFDRGLVWTYAYNHEDAVVCFQRAVEADPDCAMAYWGIAYGIGPNYNKQWTDFEDDEKPDALAQALGAIEQANRCAHQTTPAERALIEAIAQRYPQDAGIEDFGPWNDAYADAMRAVYKAHPHDLDVSCLLAEAIMNRTPWQLWDLPSGQPAEGADTVEAITVPENAFDNLDGACQHPGNVWSLHGLHECLVQRGETIEARQVKLLLDKAVARADVPIKASCFCRHQAAA